MESAQLAQRHGGYSGTPGSILVFINAYLGAAVVGLYTVTDEVAWYPGLVLLTLSLCALELARDGTFKPAPWHPGCPFGPFRAVACLQSATLPGHSAYDDLHGQKSENLYAAPVERMITTFFAENHNQRVTAKIIAEMGDDVLLKFEPVQQ